MERRCQQREESQCLASRVDLHGALNETTTNREEVFVDGSRTLSKLGRRPIREWIWVSFDVLSQRYPNFRKTTQPRKKLRSSSTLVQIDGACQFHAPAKPSFERHSLLVLPYRAKRTTWALHIIRQEAFGRSKQTTVSISQRDCQSRRTLVVVNGDRVKGVVVVEWKKRSPASHIIVEP